MRFTMTVAGKYRVDRVGWDGSGPSLWIDVDLPEVVELRKQYITSSTSGSAYQLIGADVLKDDWLESLPRNRPTAVVMEGLLSYLKAEDSRDLIAKLTKHFEHGELYFECLSSLALRAGHQASSLDVVRKTGAALQSSMDDLYDLEKIGSGIKVHEVLRFVELAGVEKLSWTRRLQMYLLSWTPGLRDGSRLIRLFFGVQPSIA